MDHRKTGLMFLSFSTFLFCTRYIAAAIYGSNSTSWDVDLFQDFITYTGGNTLLTLSIISLVIGIIYLVLGESYLLKNKSK
ncbi:hypothetical protein HF394_17765 [Planococcus glaciei]|uniref:Uncharacterized protein n=1 Tax=Planococcus glaciei TaxID=459472 RepID=A0A7H8QFF0_9BACL|nr:hypothetical protein [Planococcus glaciei]QKX52272.1 hypothetical protein HF394_17765 [Planococcus glaciei]